MRESVSDGLYLLGIWGVIFGPWVLGPIVLRWLDDQWSRHVNRVVKP